MAVGFSWYEHKIYRTFLLVIPHAYIIVAAVIKAEINLMILFELSYCESEKFGS